MELVEDLKKEINSVPPGWGIPEPRRPFVMRDMILIIIDLSEKVEKLQHELDDCKNKIESEGINLGVFYGNSD